MNDIYNNKLRLQKQLTYNLVYNVFRLSGLVLVVRKTDRTTENIGEELWLGKDCSDNNWLGKK